METLSFYLIEKGLKRIGNLDMDNRGIKLDKETGIPKDWGN